VSPRPSEIPSADAFAGALRTARDGHYDDAIAAVRDACAGREEDEAVAGAAANALARIGRSAEAADRWEEAERAVAAGLALRPRYPDLHHQHARLLLLRGHRPEARRALEQALALHPGFVAARVDRALLDAREGRIGEALQELRELAKEARIEEPPAFERGLERLREADVAEAGVWLSQALRLSDPVLEERLEHARRLLEEAEIARAAQLIREMLPAYARYPDLHALLGIAELRLGRPDDALASLARALEIHPDFHGARVQFACALQAVGQNVQAVEQIQMVIEADPENADARQLLARWAPRARSGARARTV